MFMNHFYIMSKEECINYTFYGIYFQNSLIINVYVTLLHHEWKLIKFADYSIK